MKIENSEESEKRDAWKILNCAFITSYERDNETNLDFAQARYYSMSFGRFYSADRAGPDLVNPQTLNKYRYALNNPLLYIDPDGLYEQNVHYFLTVALSIAAGFDLGTAIGIGSADWGVDTNPKTSPTKLFNLGARKKYHFTNPARRNELWGEFSSSPSADTLGTFLHALQDSFSHTKKNGKPYGAFLGHLLAGHSPDNTAKRIGLATIMVAETFAKLLEAAGAMGAGGSQIKLEDRSNGVFDAIVAFLSINKVGISKEEYEQKQADAFLNLITVILQAQKSNADPQTVVDQIRQAIANIGTERDPNVQAIRRSYSLPGSSIIEEEEALYDYRVRMAFGR